MYVCSVKVCSYVRAHIYVRVHVLCAWWRRWCWCPSSVSLHLMVEAACCWTWNSPSPLSSLEYPCFCFQSLGLQEAATSTFLYVVAGYSNSELHIYVASVLSTDPRPTHQSIREYFLDFFCLIFFLNWQSSCFSILCAGITDICSHAWLASVTYIS